MVYSGGWNAAQTAKASGSTQRIARSQAAALSSARQAPVGA